MLEDRPRERSAVGSSVWGSRSRKRIMDAALHQFAMRGVRGVRLEDIAAEAGMTRPGLLRHFASKDELVFEAHKEAALRLPSYLDAPEEVLRLGFFETLRYWLDRAGELAEGDDETYRMVLIGKFTTDLELQDRISRFWLSEDPEGTVDFVEFGQTNGEIDTEVDPLILAAIIDWIVEGLRRSVAARELDRAMLFHSRFHRDGEARLRATVSAIVDVLREGLGPADDGATLHHEAAVG
jgi:AcrR family transcriptional regulator